MLSNPFKWKHFVGEIILLNVRWYLKYPLRNDSNIISRGFVAKNDYLGNGTIDQFPN